MAADYPIAVTDQASKRIIVLDSDTTNVLWEWSPEGEDGSETPGWGLPSDVKLREHESYGGLCLVVTDSYGLAAIVPCSSKKTMSWSVVAGGNPHAAELLPDGNLAVAASDGGWVRVYTSSQGSDSTAYAEFPLPGAHGVLWDPERKLLWAVGDDRLAALSVGGAPHAPVLSQVQEKKLPTLWGHDLSPVYGNTDLLWVTTNSGVYQYKKSTDTWSSRYPGSEQANRGFVKSMGNQPSGAIVQTVPKEGALYAWGTDTADLFLPDRRLILPEASVYKARIWSPHYQ